MTHKTLKRRHRRRRKKVSFIHDDEIWRHDENLFVLKHHKSDSRTRLQSDLCLLLNDTFLHTSSNPCSLMVVMGNLLPLYGGGSLTLANWIPTWDCAACSGKRCKKCEICPGRYWWNSFLCAWPLNVQVTRQSPRGGCMMTECLFKM